VLAYYASSNSSDINAGGALQAGVITINTLTSTISLGPVTTMGSATTTTTFATTSVVSYNLIATTLSHDMVIVAYADAAQDYALVTQILNVLNDTTSSNNHIIGTVLSTYTTLFTIICIMYIAFGGSWTVNTGRVFTYSSQLGLNDFDLVTVSPGHDFALLYADTANNGAITLSIGSVTASNEIIRSAPNLLLNTNNNNNQYKYWGSLATGQSSYLDSQTLVMTMLIEGFSETTTCTNTQAM
jgi:hypothetical protein